MKISIARLKEIIMEEVARATAVELSESHEPFEKKTPASEDLEETLEIVDNE